MQRNNDCKGGMMEEWHQKLHNNNSPDDVIICQARIVLSHSYGAFIDLLIVLCYFNQALLDYVKSNFDMNVYWRTLNANGLTKSMLASYERPILSEPQFRADQKEGLIHDLSEYLKTLKVCFRYSEIVSKFVHRLC